MIDINKMEIGSDSNFGGKVTTSFQKISRLRKNITKYNWYVFTSNKYYAMVYIKDRSGIGFFARQSVTPGKDEQGRAKLLRNHTVIPVGEKLNFDKPLP